MCPSNRYVTGDELAEVSGLASYLDQLSNVSVKVEIFDTNGASVGYIRLTESGYAYHPDADPG